MQEAFEVWVSCIWSHIIPFSSNGTHDLVCRSFFYPDTEDKVPKTGRRAAQIRMKIAELSHKSPVAVNDLRGLTKLFYNSMAMATEEGVVAPKKGNEERVVVSSACPTPGHDGSQPVATSGVDNEDNATREVRLNYVVRTIPSLTLVYVTSVRL